MKGGRSKDDSGQLFPVGGSGATYPFLPQLPLRSSRVTEGQASGGGDLETTTD